MSEEDAMSEPAEDPRHPHLPEWVVNQKERDDAASGPPSAPAGEEGATDKSAPAGGAASDE